MINKINNKLITIYVIINILFIFICSILYTLTLLDQEMYGNYLLLPLFINIIISLFLIYKYKIKKKKYKINKVDIVLIIMIVCGIIATVFAYDVEFSVRGAPNRYEGLVAILYYLSLFYVTSYMDKKDRKLVAYIIVFTGVCHAASSFFQSIESPFFRVVKNKNEVWALGFTTNPNFLGTYMILSILFALGLFVEEKKAITRILLAISIFLLMVGLLVSNTMSALVGLFVVLIILLVYCILNKKIKELIIPVLIIGILFVVLNNIGITRLYKDTKKTTSEAVEITKGNVEGSFGTNRLEIWKETIKASPKHLLHGVGIDNYIYAFNGKSLILNGRYYDKAHNELLQILITEGLLAFISYIIFYSLIIIEGIKYTFKSKEIYLLLPVIGYVVQAMFNISVIEVAPIFFISLGLLYNRKSMNLS